MQFRLICRIKNFNLELYRLNQDYDTELRAEGLKLLEDIEKGDVQQVKKGYDQFLEEWNEAGMAKLADKTSRIGKRRFLCFERV